MGGIFSACALDDDGAVPKNIQQKGSVPKGRTFAASDAHGGEAVEASKLGLVMIEFQNEFTTEKGKLHDGVKAVMEETGMLAKANEVAAAVRAAPWGPWCAAPWDPRCAVGSAMRRGVRDAPWGP